MVHKSTRFHTVGENYGNFILLRVVEIPELQCVLRELVHKPTDARIMHIGNDDPENLFCLSFQTLPLSSNGVAHILEHTVLCGSKKFPVKDPFFAMNRRSLNTFMNALTGSDFTCYPAASQVKKDFYNLLEVYLDAVFHPNLNELSFLQEGFRLDFATPKDIESPLEYKGIVYNEMKGALSSPGARLAEAINANLFPNVTYGINSGGDPQDIPHLTYEELKEFHQQFYHPSRCLFFFYGNLPLEDHLDFIEQHTLKDVSSVPKLDPIPLQPRFKEPRYVELTYPVTEEEEDPEKAILAFGWLTCHILEQEDTLALNVIFSILMDTDASILKRALLKSGLCKQANYFIDVEINEIPTGLTLKGCDARNADAIQELIFNTLKEVSETGIPLELIENALHQMEFSRSEITGDQAPFGLSLFMRSALLKQHEVDPEQGLMIHSLFDKLRKDILANPFYLNHLIERYLLNNPHFVRIIMTPDKDLQSNEEEKEKQTLQSIKDSLSQEEKEKIVEKAQELADFQKAQEEVDINILPKISIKEVPLSSRNYPLIKDQSGVLTTYHHNTFTNNIVYADLVFNLPQLKEEDLFYLRLFKLVLTQMGCNGRNYIENLEYIQGNTGGISLDFSLNMQADNYRDFSPSLHLRGKALYRKAGKLFSLMQEIVTSAQLNDFDRLKEFLIKTFTAMESRLNQNALKYAINMSSSGLNVAAKVANELFGLPFYLKLREIVQNIDQYESILLTKLSELQEKLLGLENPDLILSCDGQMYNELKGHHFYGMDKMITTPYELWKPNYKLEEVPNKGLIIASPVAFIGKAFPTVSYTHPQAAALNIAAYLFDNLTLHPKIREQGGAYGGGAVSNPMSGNFYFYSYRDPNIVKTFQAFQEAIDKVANGDFEEEDLNEAKLEMIQSFDSPISPGSRADLAYGWLREGKTLEVRQNFRNKLLSTNLEEVVQAVKDIIIPNYSKGSAVVSAGKVLLEEENKKLEEEGFKPLQIEGI